MSARKLPLLLLCGILAFSGCGGSSKDAQGAPPAGTSSSSGALSSSSTAPPSSGGASTSPTAESSSSLSAVASPGASSAPSTVDNVGAVSPSPQRKGYIPEGAVPVTAFFPTGGGRDYAILVSPSGNIGCDISDDGYGGCGVKSYVDENKYGAPGGVPQWVFGLGDNVQEVTLGARGDAMFFMMDRENPSGDTAQVVPYGTSAYYGSIACESTEQAMTCWNVKTGRGVVMSREGYSTF